MAFVKKTFVEENWMETNKDDQTFITYFFQFLKLK